MLGTFVRYNVVQALSFGLDYSVFMLVIWHDPQTLLMANVLSKMAAGLFAFTLHKHVTFRQSGSDRLASEAVLYVSLLGFNMAVTSALLAQLVAVLPSPIAKPVADVLCMMLTFILTKLFVFKDQQPVVETRD